MNKGAILFSPGPFGGAEKLILDSVKDLQIPIIIIKELRNPKSARVFVDMLKEQDIEPIIIDSRKRYDKELILNLNKIIQDKNIHFIHSHGLKANFINASLNVKRIATQHGQTSHSLKMKLMELIENKSLKKMNQVIYVSEAMYKDSSLKNKILIENFIPELGNINNSIKMHKPFKIVYAGRLSKEKGIEFLLSSIDTSMNIELNIYGNGELKEYVTQNTNEKVLYHGFSTNIKETLLEANLLIIPSQREGLPMIALEACALGLPTLSTRVGGLPKLLENDKYLMEFENANELNEKIKHIINQYDEVLNQFQLIQDRTLENYSKKKWLDKVLKLYKSLS